MKMIRIANQYVKGMTLFDFILAKLCLVSFGVAIGASLKGWKKNVLAVMAVICFIITYIPLLVKLILLFVKEKND